MSHSSPALPVSRVLQRFAEVVVNPAALFHGGDDGSEIVIGDDHVHRLPGDFGAGSSHGDADVGPLDGRGTPTA